MRLTIATVIALVVLAAPVSASDSRLLQKITYQGGGKRLHVIAEELTKQTGVTIRAGDNKQDWRVRDIPLTVYVKDMPLGDLLKTLADCAHVEFAQEKIANAATDKPVYKLYRTRKQQQAIDAKIQARIDANRAHIKWTWDVLAAYADMPESSGKANGTSKLMPKSMGALLKCFGTQGRDKVLSGEVLKLGFNGSAGPGFSRLPKATLEFWGCGKDGANVEISIFAPPQMDVGQAGLFLRWCSHSTSSAGQSSQPGPDMRVFPAADEASALASDKSLNLPKEPDAESMFKDDEPFPGTGFVELKADPDWKAPLLQEKIKLVLPPLPPKPTDPMIADTRGPSASDILKSLADASKLNIISEDFESQKTSHTTGMGQRITSGDTTPVGVLKATYTVEIWGGRWFLNKDRKLIVGWVHDWQVTHQGLIPEALFESIRSKMKTSGVELDDVIELVDLDLKQQFQWVWGTEIEWSFPKSGGAATLAMQRLYKSLSADEKDMAKSDLGLPLAGLDTTSIAALIKTAQDELNKKNIGFTPAAGLVQNDLPTDARSLARMTLKITRDSIPSSVPFEAHVYSARLISDQGHETVIPMTSTSFPIFTPERKAEVIKQAQGTEKK